MIKKVLTTALIMVTICLGTNAQTVTSAEVKNSITKILETSYSKMTKGEVHVKVTATPFAQLVLPDGQITYKITQGEDRIVSCGIKRVEIYVNNEYIKTLNLPVQTSVYENVLVAAEGINRDQTITRESVIVKRTDVSQKADYILTEDMLRKEMFAKKFFVKGEIIDKRFVKIKPDVERNMAVRIFFVSRGAVMITIDGTALADGMLGDYINVENKNYKKVYTGKIIGENQVLVNM